MMHGIFKGALVCVTISLFLTNCSNDTKPEPVLKQEKEGKITTKPAETYEALAVTEKTEIETVVANPKPKSVEVTKKKEVAKPFESQSPPKSAKVEVVEQKSEIVDKKEEVVFVAEEVVVERKIKGIDHSAWDAFLRKFVSNNGVVDYAAIKANPKYLEGYLEHLKTNHPKSDWTRNEKMAYWINAYNAFTVKKIVDNFPLKSIIDLDGGKPWDVKWIKLGTKTYSLNQIENEILRPKFGDARIHFAVNCAAKSCPPLLNRAFTSKTLNSQLASQTKKFVNNPSYTTISEGSAAVSKIFEWYAVDFGDLRAFLNTYSSTKLNADATISYKEYDWALNGK